MIKLSICIATLNRGPFLRETLESIIPQMKKNIEIVVIDGASTDNTEEIVKKLKTKCNNISYVKLKQKGGVDKDFNIAINKAKGEFCWFFSDDDIFLSDAISQVIKCLKQNIDLLIINSQIRSKNLSKILKPKFLNLNSNLYFKKNQQELFLSKLANLLSFIGCVVIRRSIWVERNPELYFGTWFGHIGVIFEKKITNGVFFNAKPLIAIRYGNASWSNSSFIISLYKWPKLIWSLKNISEETKVKITEKEPWKKTKNLIIFRARGAYDFKLFRQFILKNYKSRIKVILPFLICIIPGFFLNTLLLLFFLIFKNLYENANLQIYDLKISKYYYKNLLWK